MGGSSRQRALVGLVATLAVVGALVAPAAGQEPDPGPLPDRLASEDLAAVPLTPSGSITTGKAPSSRMAQTDPDLLGRTDDEPVPVLIKFDYDAIASYDGSLRALPATSPSVTGRALTSADAATSPYARQVARDEAAIVADMEAAVPSVEVGQSLRVVFGGVAARVPANQVEALLEVHGVVAVQADELHQPLTEASPSLIGAPEVWAQVGGQADAGAGLLFGSLDTGIWPEHPSFADTGQTPPRPTAPDGSTLACDFGDDPLTAEEDPFTCQDKLVAGHAFMDTYRSTHAAEPFDATARDVEGHGTHTASTAAGNITEASTFGIDRGQVSGVAPGAWVAAYKVCGMAGCHGSDSVAAVAQAILDGVDVINYSISGGVDPATDPVELAFLDAYAAGVFVATSAGNDGPGAGTVNHLGPWVTSVAASSQSRVWESTLTLDGDEGAMLEVVGASVGVGVAGPLPIVMASAPPYGNTACTAPAAPGTFTGKIVVCERSNGSRVLKGHNVSQGGAAGMVLYNPGPSNLATDSHWLPTVHIPDGAPLAAFLAANPGATARFTAGAEATAPADVVAPFSSRGPRGLVIKPDIAAPGQQVLAGHTPAPANPRFGPPGELFQSIDGTSMAAPHVAGAALVLRDRHPGWTPGQVRSALMATASPEVTTGDGTTPASPFEVGSGRLRLDGASAPGLVLDETAERFATLGTDPVAAVHLNIASVNAPVMPGRLVTTRTVTNPGPAATYAAATTAGPGSTITVTPASFTLAEGESQDLTVTIDSTNTGGVQELGAITLTAPGRAATRLPVSFVPQPGDVRITGLGCTPDAVAALDEATCTFAVENQGFTDTTVDLRAEGDASVEVTGADQGATVTDGTAAASGVPLPGVMLGSPTVAPGASPAGFLPLSAFGVDPTPVGDETLLNFNVPSFRYNGETYARVGVSSNGYLVVGGGEAEDNQCCGLTQIPDPARPNNVLAPFWTDLDGTGTPGIYIATLTDNVKTWLIVEWQVNVFGTTSNRHFQVWMGVDGTEDVTFAYDPAALPADPGLPFLVGAENRSGTGGAQLPAGTLPTEDLRVTGEDLGPAGSITWEVQVRATAAGTGVLTAEAATPLMAGSTVARQEIPVHALPLPVVTDDPDDLTVAARETATFTAAATGGTFSRWERRAPGAPGWSTVAGATTTTLAVTAHGDMSGTRYRAVFANATGHEQASDVAILTVTRLATTTAVGVAPDDAPLWGQDVAVMATVSPTTATGMVQFALDGAPLGAPVALSGGTAAGPPVPDQAVGAHAVTATYAGDVDHAGSVGTSSFTVQALPSSVPTVTVDPPEPRRGQDIVFTATVASPGATGVVQFAVDGEDVGSLVPVVGGVATSPPVRDLPAGEHVVVAVYGGDLTHLGSSSAPAAFFVAKNLSTTTITEVGPALPVAGGSVVVEVEVDPARPGRPLEVRVDGDLTGTPAFLDGTGRATITVSGLAAGEHEIDVRFPGDDDMIPSGATTSVIVHASAEAFVYRAYQVVLGRSGDAAGVAYWSDVIAQGVSPEAVTLLMSVSLEAHNRLVEQTYRRALGRGADAAGRAYWAERLRTGLTAEDLLATMLATDEARRKAGNTPDGLAELLYTTHLGRTGGTAERAYWADRIAASDTPAGRRSIALAFGRTAEAVAVAVRGAGTETCGGSLAPGLTPILTSRWSGSAHHPLRQAGSTLALACPPGP